MGWLLIAVVIALLVAFIFMPQPQQPDMKPASLDDFTIPDNSSSKVVPILYGTSYVVGNIIYYANLRNTGIYVESPDKK